jgi:small GTP-binding protein
MQIKKICLLGASGVGKTSMVSRYVHQIFSEKYLTTIGVKVDKKQVEIGETSIKLMIWDLAGEDEFEQLQMKYTRGAQGCLIVVDGTRPRTFDTALSVHQRFVDQNGNLPCIFLFNKHDLTERWAITEENIAEVAGRDVPWFNTSAKEDRNVNEAFGKLAGLTIG